MNYHNETLDVNTPTQIKDSCEHLLLLKKVIEREYYPEFKDVQKNIDNLKASITTALKAECKHEYVEDYIDSDIDNGGKYITYCSKCECTFT